MDIKYTNEEIRALEKKEMFPRKEVKCPRCGKFLDYHSFGNSCEIKCETENCLKMIIRGI